LVAVGTIARAALAVVVVAMVGGVAWLAMPRANPAPAPAPVPGLVPGRIELRRIDLAFDTGGTVHAMAREEGDVVHAGELVAELDTTGFVNAQALAAAARNRAKTRLDLLLAGTRPEQVERDRALLAGAMASQARAEATFSRQEDLFGRKVVAQQAYDDALMMRDNARAAVAQYQAVLAEAIAGPRPLDIEAARADLGAAEAELQRAGSQLALTKLRCPVDGVVTARAVEPGIVVRPGAPVYTLAVTGEVWVRAFAPEALLGSVAAGTVLPIGGADGHAWNGRVVAVVAAAEAQAAQPVYRLRIQVEHPDDTLREGMPVTVTLPPVPAA
jgi:HlyD family secretion protein